MSFDRVAAGPHAESVVAADSDSLCMYRCVQCMYLGGDKMTRCAAREHH